MFSGTIAITIYTSIGVKTPDMGNWSSKPNVGFSLGDITTCESTFKEIEVVLSGKIQVPGFSANFPVGSYKATTGLKAQVKAPNGSVSIGGNLNIGLEGSVQKEGNLAL
jgi:hypothetical protein